MGIRDVKTSSDGGLFLLYEADNVILVLAKPERLLVAVELVLMI